MADAKKVLNDFKEIVSGGPTGASNIKHFFTSSIENLIKFYEDISSLMHINKVDNDISKNFHSALDALINLRQKFNENRDKLGDNFTVEDLVDKGVISLEELEDFVNCMKLLDTSFVKPEELQNFDFDTLEHGIAFMAAYDFASAQYICFAEGGHERLMKEIERRMNTSATLGTGLMDADSYLGNNANQLDFQSLSNLNPAETLLFDREAKRQNVKFGLMKSQGKHEIFYKKEDADAFRRVAVCSRFIASSTYGKYIVKQGAQINEVLKDAAAALTLTPVTYVSRNVNRALTVTKDGIIKNDNGKEQIFTFDELKQLGTDLNTEFDKFVRECNGKIATFTNVGKVTDFNKMYQDIDKAPGILAIDSHDSATRKTIAESFQERVPFLDFMRENLTVENEQQMLNDIENLVQETINQKIASTIRNIRETNSTLSKEMQDDVIKSALKSEGIELSDKDLKAWCDLSPSNINTRINNSKEMINEICQKKLPTYAKGNREDKNIKGMKDFLEHSKIKKCVLLAQGFANTREDLREDEPYVRGNDELNRTIKKAMDEAYKEKTAKYTKNAKSAEEHEPH